MQNSTFVMSADGTPIAYEVADHEGPVVVLVEPPLHHRAMSAYAALVPLLASDLTVVTYDRRGRGDSGDAGDYHPDRESEDLDAVIDAVGGAAGVYGTAVPRVRRERTETAASAPTTPPQWRHLCGRRR